MTGLYLKRLTLKNYCYYEEHTFDFTKSDGSPYQFICFYGPNGIGKSSLLEAILLLVMNRFGRGMDRIRQSLLKYVHSENYDPSYNRIGVIEDAEPTDPKMFIEGIYMMNGKEYVVQMNEMGWIRNDFVPLPSIEDPTLEEMSEAARTGPWGSDYLRHIQRIAHFVSSDNDLSLNKFQLVKPYIDEFETIMTDVMHWPAKCIMPIEIRGTRAENKMYCSDFVIEKKKQQSGKKITTHFKRMSAGEKKIAKSFSDLLNLMYTLENPGAGGIQMVGWPRLLLIDNVEMHAYYDRHIRMVDSLKSIFHHQQIFATTHSGILIQRAKDGLNKGDELFIDLDEVNA